MNFSLCRCLSLSLPPSLLLLLAIFSPQDLWFWWCDKIWKHDWIIQESRGERVHTENLDLSETVVKRAHDGVLA